MAALGLGRKALVVSALLATLGLVTSSAHAEEPTVATQRNSTPLMFTGIGISVLGLGAVGGGVGAMVAGTRQCDASSTSAVFDAGLSATPGVYSMARQHCRDQSDLLAGGLGLVIGGSILTAVGAAFTIAGAWKVRLRPTVADRYVGVVGTF